MIHNIIVPAIMNILYGSLAIIDSETILTGNIMFINGIVMAMTLVVFNASIIISIAIAMPIALVIIYNLYRHPCHRRHPGLHYLRRRHFHHHGHHCHCHRQC
jgi:hypothetical protein